MRKQQMRSFLDRKGVQLALTGLQLLWFMVPALLLLGAALRTAEPATARYLMVGSGFLMVVACCTTFASASWRHLTGSAAIMLYLMGLGWILLGWRGRPDWYMALSQSVLWILPLCALAYQVLRDSGVIEMRRAQVLARRIASRRDLRLDVAACRDLPEVKAFREALHRNVTPALALLCDKRPEVRLAALCAMEFRKNWHRGQPELVLRLARAADEPKIRAAAVMALANLSSRELIEKLAIFLRDPAEEVRRAAATALLWDSEHRWGWIRMSVQEAMADPMLVRDGSIWRNGPQLVSEAVADLSGWAAAGGNLGVRASATLAAHYRRVLQEQNNLQIVRELRQSALNPSVSTTLRQDLAQVLLEQDELPPDALEQLQLPANPAPLRLLAAEAILTRGESTASVQTLRELARLPNREIALATACVVQRRLGQDLGLDLDAPLPALHSRQAAEITRRVMRWSAEETFDPAVSATAVQ